VNRTELAVAIGCVLVIVALVIWWHPLV